MINLESLTATINRVIAANSRKKAVEILTMLRIGFFSPEERELIQSAINHLKRNK